METHQTFHATEESAERIAARCRADDPEWRYVVRHTLPRDGCAPWWIVQVYDENGKFLGTL